MRRSLWRAALALLLCSAPLWQAVGQPVQPRPADNKSNHDLTLDARMVVERVELLSWYLQNDTHTVAHLAMVLLEGPFEDIAKEVVQKCRGDYDSIRAAIKDIVVVLPRASGVVSFGESPASHNLRELIRKAWMMADREDGQIGLHHLFLSLTEIKTFNNILVNNGCDINILKQAVVDEFRGRTRGVIPSSFQELAGGEKGAGEFDLSQYGVDLSFMARQGMLPPVIGREDEIDRIIQLLSRKMTKAPILLGEAGVGKTAVVEGLAQRIVEGAVPDSLANRRIFSLDLLSLTAGSSMRGEFEKRMKLIITYLQKHADTVILFIDEIHTLIGAGKTAGSMDASQMLKVPLARGEIIVIGATTLEEYKLYMEKDPAFCRRFQPVVVEAPSKERTLYILTRVKHKYEKHHNMDISDDVLKVVVNLADQYVKSRFFPDKALDLLDDACAIKRVKHNARLGELAKKLEEAKTGEQSLDQEELEEIEEEYKKMTVKRNGRDPDRLVLDVDDVATVLSTWTGIPVGRMTEDEMSKILKLSQLLSARVVGQTQAVNAVANAIRIQRAGLNEGKKPLGAFLFLGSSGVGKTELAKALASEMFHSESNLIRLDMVEFQEAHSISRLIGPPPGYMGNDEGGQLTEAVRQKPHSVVLFDEVENAHKNLWSLLLPMLDEGHLTDSKNVRVDFTNTIIILTSNIGQQHILDGYKEARAVSQGAAAPLAKFNPETKSLERFALASAGAKLASSLGGKKEEDKKGATANAVAKKKEEAWNTSGNNAEEILRKMRQKVLQEVLTYFKPQVVGRMTEIIIFEPLTEQSMRGVLDLMFKGLVGQLKKRQITLEVTDGAKDYILKRAWSHKFGGRRMAKYIEKYIVARIAPLVLSEELKSGDKAMLRQSKKQPNQLNLIVCREGPDGNCLPGRKKGLALVLQPPKPQVANGDEEDPMI